MNRIISLVLIADGIVLLITATSPFLSGGLAVLTGAPNETAARMLLGSIGAGVIGLATLSSGRKHSKRA